MTKRLLSKLPLETYCLIAFCGSLIFSVLSQEIIIEFSILFFALTVSVYLALIKNKFALVFLIFSIGIFWVNYNQLLISRVMPNSCEEVEILSRPNKFKNGFIYKVAQNKSYLINFEKDDLGLADKVKLCRIGTIELEKKDSSYFLAKYKLNSVYKVSDVAKISQGESTKRKLADFSQNINNSTREIFTGDKSVLAYGLLFGSSGDFSYQTKQNLKKSGTTHLVAVSGYNVSIITAWLFTTLRSISKNFAGIFSVIALAIFYFLTGGSASVLRAALMGSLILISKFVGRKVLGLHMLLLAAGLILLFNPYAIYDWGFQLSFLATAGLFFLSPALEEIINFRKINSIFIKIFAETLGAQIFVLPIMAGNFGQFSIISPIANLLILPIVPAAMFLIAVSLVFHSFSSLLGMFFGGLSSILLEYILWVINFTAGFKFSSIEIKVNPVFAYTIGYLLVILFTIFLRRKVGSKK